MFLWFLLAAFYGDCSMKLQLFGLLGVVLAYAVLRRQAQLRRLLWRLRWILGIWFLLQWCMDAQGTWFPVQSAWHLWQRLQLGLPTLLAWLVPMLVLALWLSVASVQDVFCGLRFWLRGFLFWSPRVDTLILRLTLTLEKSQRLLHEPQIKAQVWALLSGNSPSALSFPPELASASDETSFTQTYAWRYWDAMVLLGVIIAALMYSHWR